MTTTWLQHALLGTVPQELKRRMSHATGVLEIHHEPLHLLGMLMNMKITAQVDYSLLHHQASGKHDWTGSIIDHTVFMTILECILNNLESAWTITSALCLTDYLIILCY